MKELILGSVNGNREKNVDTRLADILAMRRDHQTLQTIGDKYSICRERVRQIIKRAPAEMIIDVPRQSRVKKARIVAYPLNSAKVRKWLAEINHGYCSRCHQAVPAMAMQANNIAARRCRACNTKAHKEYCDKHIDHSRAVQKAWVTAHPDKVREYASRWQAKNQDKLKEYRRAYQERQLQRQRE